MQPSVALMISRERRNARQSEWWVRGNICERNSGLWEVMHHHELFLHVFSISNTATIVKKLHSSDVSRPPRLLGVMDNSPDLSRLCNRKWTGFSSVAWKTSIQLMIHAALESGPLTIFLANVSYRCHGFSETEGHQVPCLLQLRRWTMA